MPMHALRGGALLLLLLLASAARAQSDADVDAVAVLQAAVLQPLVPGEASPSVAGRCRRDAADYRSALAELQPWAMNMFDASAKLSGGVLWGAASQLGQPEQCAAARHAGFAGRHCTAAVAAAVRPYPGGAAPVRYDGSLRYLVHAAAVAAGLDASALTQTVTYKWSYCVPSSCSADDVLAELDAKLAALRGDPAANLTVSVDPSSCMAGDDLPQPLPPELIVFLCLVLLLAFTVALATTLEALLLEKYKYGDLWAVVKAFSLSSSWKTFSHTPAGPSGSRIDCFDGARFISICWIVLGHSYYMTAVRPLLNAIQITEWKRQWYRMPVMNGTVSTDSFFVLSSALLAMGFLRQHERQRPRALEVARMLLLRYVRLTPVYALLVFFYAAALLHLGGGPLWGAFARPEVDNCRRYWWTNLLYVNNYVHLEAPCMNQTWYLAADMQMFAVALLLLSAMACFPRAAPSILLAAFVACVATPTAISAALGLPGAMLYTTDDRVVGSVFVSVYTPSYSRAGPYVVGLSLGYILHRLRGKDLRLKLWQECVLWTLSAAVWVLLIPAALPMYGAFPAVPQPWSALYAGTHRTAWSMALAWLLLACAKGRAPPLAWLLSWKVYRPLGALVYCVYLTHYAILIYIDGTTRIAGYFTDFYMIQSTIGVLAMSLAVSLALHLGVELPALALSKHFLRPRRPLSAQLKQSQDSYPVISTLHTIQPVAVPHGETEVKSGYVNGGLDLGPELHHQPQGYQSTGEQPAPILPTCAAKQEELTSVATLTGSVEGRL